MNPLTQVKRTQQINLKEASLGISEEASWHSKFRDSAYVFVGGIPFDLTEGDLLAVFAQYGEVVDVNLVRDKSTGKSRGFAFLAYEDQRSTILAVDNLNGAKILGRIVRVDHVSKYKKKEEEDEDEEERNRKREARGVCRAFQRGECTRGDSCKFSHDQQRAANTGWGSEDAESRWAKRTADFPEESSRGRNKRREEINTDSQVKDGGAGRNKRREETNTDSHVKDGGTSRVNGDGAYKVRSSKDEKSMRDPDPKRKDKFPEDQGRESRHRHDGDGRTSERQTMRERSEAYSGNRERERQERKDRYSSSYDHEEDEREHRRRSRG